MAKAATKKSAPKQKSGDIEVHFNLAKETKGALRYEEDGFDADNMDATAIGTLYLRKAAFSDGNYPQHITVKVIAVSA